jgi:hypothetical protein
MLETPTVWLRNPVVMAKVIWTWLLPKYAKTSLYPPKPGPARDEMFITLGLSQATT